MAARGTRVDGALAGTRYGNELDCGTVTTSELTKPQEPSFPAYLHIREQIQSENSSTSILFEGQ